MDVPAGVTQEEGHTGFLIHLHSAVRALIFLARRIQPFLSLVDRGGEFCVLRIQAWYYGNGNFVYFQVNNGVLYCFWIMKILIIMVLCCACFNYCIVFVFIV